MRSPNPRELPKDYRSSTSTAVLLPGVYSPLAPSPGPLPQAAVSHLPLDICRLRSLICCREGMSPAGGRVTVDRVVKCCVLHGWLAATCGFRLHRSCEKIHPGVMSTAVTDTSRFTDSTYKRISHRKRKHSGHAVIVASPYGLQQ